LTGSLSGVHTNLHTIGSAILLNKSPADCNVIGPAVRLDQLASRFRAPPCTLPIHEVHEEGGAHMRSHKSLNWVTMVIQPSR